jgi:septal ring factor EnvC (AmiA/AmiB activator)
MAEPRLRWDFSFGNIVNLVALIIAVGVSWGVMSERSTASQKQVQALETTLTNMISQKQTEDAKLELRVRNLETNQARADERLSSILQVLGRIEARLERFEVRK